VGPFYRDEPDPESSIPFLWLNTGKKSITLNLKHETGKEIFRTLVRDIDLVIENFSPRVMPGLGLDYSVLQSINAHLIMTSISNFGQAGPYRDYRAV
jgi:crotonobetainyl-CoA:carnitine CoA-transferase CaiB-like acyl-CoA transferase